MNSNNTAFYSTCDDSYIPYSVTSLLSIKKYIPNANLFVISRDISKNNKKLLSKLNIQYIEIDLMHLFYKTWTYPLECYYIFAGPELLDKKGFDYSVYIDGDVICKRNPLLNIEINSLAAAPSSRVKDVFINDWNKVKELFEVSEEQGNKVRLNSGVVYFNNKRMVEEKLLDKSAEVYDTCIKEGIPRKGDDSILTLLIVKLFTDSVELEPGYNYLNNFKYDNKIIKDKLVFYHFLSNKPWKKIDHSIKTSEEENYIQEYQSILRSLKYKNNITLFSLIKRKLNKLARISKDIILNVRGLKLSLHKRRKNCRKAPIKIWWWRFKNGLIEVENFGDAVTTNIINSIYGYRTVFSEMYQCQMIGIGSIMKAAVEYSGDNIVNIWGSGFLKDNSDDPIRWKSNLYVWGCRGTNTAKRIPNEQKKVDYSLGDPGLLVNLVYKRNKRTNKIGIITNFENNNDKLLKKLRFDDRFVIINPLSNIDDIIKQLTSCKLILSSSLHGLIFADSYKIPNYHIEMTHSIAGGDYKFIDYYSGIKKNYIKADISKIGDDEYIKKLIKDYEPIKGLAHIQRSIIRSFPYY